MIVGNNQAAQAAPSMLAAGFSVFPTNADKTPALSWKRFQRELMRQEEVPQKIHNGHQLGVVCGKVSGNLECLDFDKPDLFQPFIEMLRDVDGELASKLVKRQTPSGGYHLIYRSTSLIEGNQKLAVSKDGKETWIETRGEGGYFLTAPSIGYSVLEHSLIDTPTLTTKEVALLHSLSRSFTEKKELVRSIKTKATINNLRPGDDYNQKADETIWRELLESNGWSFTSKIAPGGIHITRPGKERGTSATLKDGCLYVFSSNAGLPSGANDAFSVYTHLKHNGSFENAARELGRLGYGEQPKKQTTQIAVEEKREWPAPIIFDDIETPEIPARLLPGVLGEFAKSIAVTTETPEAMSVMTTLGVVSACAAKRFAVSPINGWQEPVNIYSAVALPPGNNKSLVLNSALSPLIEWDREQAEIKGPEIKRQRSERKSQEKLIESKRHKMVKEKNPEKQAEMIKKIADIEASLIEQEAMPQMFCNDATPEALANNTQEQGGRFAVFTDEGGILETMSGLYSGGSANVDIFLKGIDGGHVRVRRGNRSFDLNPYLTFILCIQPIILQNMVSKKSFRGNGSIERFLFVLPKSQLGFRTHNKPPVPDSIKQSYKQKIKSILDIPPIKNNGQEQPRILTLSPDALEDWRKFQAAIEIQLRPGGRLEPCQGWGGKICGFALRLAGLLHIAEHGQDHLIILGEIMGRALELAALLTDHALAAFLLMGTDENTDDAKRILNWIISRDEPNFTQSEIRVAMKNQKFGKGDRLNKAINVLVERYILDGPDKVVGINTTKPKKVYHVNPAILNKGV